MEVWSFVGVTLELDTKINIERQCSGDFLGSTSCTTFFTER